MNPHITSGGSSFRGAYLYYMHDKGANTRNRIAWTHTENMMTNDPDLAWKVMSYTAMGQDRLKEASGQKRTGRKTEKPVLAYSLSWHPEQNPNKDHMLEVAQRSIKMLGLSDHEAIIIAHQDTPHKHVHVIVNRVHPITGLVANGSNSKRKLSGFALEYAHEHGLNYAPQRQQNARERENSSHNRKIQDEWDSSHDGESLIFALEQNGFRLAHGNKRLVVVDASGKVHNPVRHIRGINAKDFRERLGSEIYNALPQIDEVVAEIKEKPSNSHEQLEASYRKYIEELKRLHQIKERQAEIKELQKKIKNARWWHKLLGITRRHTNDLNKARQDYCNVNERIKTQVRIWKKAKLDALGKSNNPTKRPAKRHITNQGKSIGMDTSNSGLSL